MHLQFAWFRCKMTAKWTQSELLSAVGGIYSIGHGNDLSLLAPPLLMYRGFFASGGMGRAVMPNACDSLCALLLH